MSSIGDVVHALPIAAIIKRERPGAFVGWVVRKRCADLLTGNPDIDRVYVLPDRPRLADLRALRRQLRGDRYDIALDMQGLLLSGIVTWLSGAKRRVGLDLNRESNTLFLTEPIVRARADRERHAIDILRGFLPTVGIDENVPWQHLDYLAKGTALPDEFMAAKRDKGRIALNVGASTVYKQWMPERWAELARLLAMDGYVPVLIGGPQDVEAASEIALLSGVSNELIDLTGKTTLRGTAAVLKACDLLVSADTGPLHLGAAVGVPVVALFGPTNPVRTGPYGDNNHVIWHQLACGPCVRKATCEGRVDCMKLITVWEVYAAAQALLADKEGSVACPSAS